MSTETGPHGRYSRQVLVDKIGAQGQENISRGVAVIVGLGALGSGVANLLARAGVGRMRLVDRDIIDWSNLQRQTLYYEADARAGLPKAIVAAERLRQANSEIQYEPVVDDVGPANVEELIAGATVVVDGLDNFFTRALINQACVKHGIPWVHGACISTHGTVMTVVPGRGPCYECLLPEVGTMTSPHTCDTVGILGPTAMAVAAREATEALKILAGRAGEATAGLTIFDLWTNEFRALTVDRADGCSVCGERRFPLLERGDPLKTTTLCGRDAVQVVPSLDLRFDFDAVARTLRRSFASQLEENPYVLRLHLPQDGYEIVLFRNGRAIIFGTTDENTAKSVYVRYIGG
jgi:adenylyltransferase/sulfurtransferase